MTKPTCERCGKHPVFRFSEDGELICQACFLDDEKDRTDYDLMQSYDRTAPLWLIFGLVIAAGAALGIGSFVWLLSEEGGPTGGSQPIRMFGILGFFLLAGVFMVGKAFMNWRDAGRIHRRLREREKEIERRQRR